MKQLLFTTLTDEWVKLEDLITIDSTKTYHIHNRGIHDFLWVEPDSDPEGAEGDSVPYHKTLIYEQGSNTLYLKSSGDRTQINISEEE